MNQGQHCDLLIHNACVNHRGRRAPRVLARRGGGARPTPSPRSGPRGRSVQRVRAARTIDAGGAVVHPGYIDAHNHVVGAGCRGVFANDSDDPASGVNYAAWKADVTSRDEAAATTLTALQLLHAGYTGVVEAGTVFDTRAAAAGAEAAGIRICLSAPYLWDDISVMRHLGSLESRALFARSPRGLRALHRGARLRAPSQRRAGTDGSTGSYASTASAPPATSSSAGPTRSPGSTAWCLHQHEAYEPSLHAGGDRAARAFPHRAPGLARRAPRRLQPWCT